MMSEAPKLGTWVIAPGKLLRSRESRKRKWYRPDWSQRHVTGIYIGSRTYANGTVDWDGDDCPYFIPTDRIKVALIVPNGRSNPVPVLFEEMQILPPPPEDAG